MKRAIAVFMLSVVILCVALSAAGCGEKDDKDDLSITGYLVCKSCGALSRCPADDIDLSNRPEAHRLACLKEPDCIVSGYGLMLDQDENAWSGIHNDAGSYIFYPFDYAGSRLALEEVIYKSKKTDDLLVEVKGAAENGEIRVEEIKEK